MEQSFRWKRKVGTSHTNKNLFIAAALGKLFHKTTGAGRRKRNVKSENSPTFSLDKDVYSFSSVRYRQSKPGSPTASPGIYTYRRNERKGLTGRTTGRWNLVRKARKFDNLGKALFNRSTNEQQRSIMEKISKTLDSLSLKSGFIEGDIEELRFLYWNRENW